MDKLPVVSGREVVRRLEKVGFVFVRRKGSHLPVHKGKTLKPGTLRGILRKADISVERLLELL